MVGWRESPSEYLAFSALWPGHPQPHEALRDTADGYGERVLIACASISNGQPVSLKERGGPLSGVGHAAGSDEGGREIISDALRLWQAQGSAVCGIEAKGIFQ